MVNHQHIPLLQSDYLLYRVEERALVAKTGNPEDNEDFIHISPFFVAVIDGVTAKSERRWDGKSGGQVCAQLIDQVLSQLPCDATAKEAVDVMTARIKSFYEEHDVLETVREDPSQRVTACVVVASLYRREIWFVGDCQCLLDKRLLLNIKPVDTITAQARAMFLEAELQNGITIEELHRHDTGRAFILPLLKQQQHFQNNPSAGRYWYPVLDGFPLPEGGIRIEPFPKKAHTIVLASDGYPVLKNSLEASEQALQLILENDPLLFRSYKATKGVQEGYVSYDDRAYIKLKLVGSLKWGYKRKSISKFAKKVRKKKKLGERKG